MPKTRRRPPPNQRKVDKKMIRRGEQIARTERHLQLLPGYRENETIEANNHHLIFIASGEGSCNAPAFTLYSGGVKQVSNRNNLREAEVEKLKEIVRSITFLK